MKVPEVLWRTHGVVRDSAERLTRRAWRHAPPLSRIVNGRAGGRLVRPAVIGRHTASLSAEALDNMPRQWRKDAVVRAEAVARHRLDLFDLRDVHLGDPIDWNFEFKAGKPTPMRFAPDIDYRDYDVTGDCKFAWEPSRHQQLVTLARAFRYTGDERFAKAVLEQIDSWMDQCPFQVGMQWRSPLELAIRLINWVWALSLIDSADALSRIRLERAAAVAFLHMREISRKYSRYSSANNHLIGEAAGVFIGAAYFCSFKDAARWRRQSRAILEHEIVAQTYPDGGNREQALGYHLFALQFFLLAGLAARNIGEEFDPNYWQTLERMFGFAAAFIDGDEFAPMYGDSDDGYVLDLGRRLNDPSTLMGVGAVLFERADFKALVGECREPVFWLFGDHGLRRFEDIDGRQPSPAQSRAFPETGCYILESGQPGGSDHVRVVFDCGELGFKSIAAHGHADALAVSLRAAGCDILVDPGTYDYFTHPSWRRYFRSTAAHNTVVVDGEDQSEMLGSFLWGRRANASCICWSPTEDGGAVVGEHDGYRRLTDPVTHRRKVELDGRTQIVTIVDELSARRHHDLELHLHFGERCRVSKLDDRRFEVHYAAGRAVVEPDLTLTVQLVTGSEEPIQGWVSGGYHHKSASTTLVGRRSFQGPVTLRTRITVVPQWSSDAREGNTDALTETAPRIGRAGENGADVMRSEPPDRERPETMMHSQQDPISHVITRGTRGAMDMDNDAIGNPVALWGRSNE